MLTKKWSVMSTIAARRKKWRGALRLAMVTMFVGVALGTAGAGPVGAAPIPPGCVVPGSFSDTLCFDVGGVVAPVTLSEPQEPGVVVVDTGAFVPPMGTKFGPAQILYVEPDAMAPNNISDAVVMGLGVPDPMTGAVPLVVGLVSDGVMPLNTGDVVTLVDDKVPANWESATPKNIAEFLGFQDVTAAVFANSTAPAPFSVFIQLDAEAIPEPSWFGLALLSLVPGITFLRRRQERACFQSRSSSPITSAPAPSSVSVKVGWLSPEPSPLFLRRDGIISKPALGVSYKHRLVSVLSLGLLIGAAGSAQAGPLNPNDFAALAATFPAAAGSYTFNTTATNPTLTTPGGTVITGVVSNGIAVFTYGSITIDADQTLTATGTRPVALLSQDDEDIAGVVNVNGNPGKPGGGLQSTAGGVGGPGGGSGGNGGGPGQNGGNGIGPGMGMGGLTFPNSGSGGGGGGFGGMGGGPQGRGGPPYGNLMASLQGGSGGGGGGASNANAGGAGGGGGGAIEIGAVDDVTISGMILANGGNGGAGTNTGAPGAGGSGGGIFIHAADVTLIVNGILSALGGDAGTIPVGQTPAGGGGGGRILILAPTSGFVDKTGGKGIKVAGGTASDDFPEFNGAPGNITVVPEPPSLALLGIGVLGLLGVCCRRHAVSSCGPEPRQ